MTMPPRLRAFALTVHLVFSVGWIGAVLTYLALGVAAATSDQVRTVRAAWIAMETTGWYVIVPLAFGSLLTGVVMAFGTRWGLLDHYWVLISFGLTIVATAVLMIHMPDVTVLAAAAQEAEGAALRQLGGDLLHPGLGLVVLLMVQVLNVYKPRGMTRRGLRRRHRQAPRVAVP